MTPDRSIRSLLRRVVPYLTGGQGNCPIELTNEAREAVGMKALKVRGLKDAANVAAFIRAHNDGSGVPETTIAKGLGLGHVTAREAVLYLKRHGKARPCGSERVPEQVWPVERWELIDA